MEHSEELEESLSEFESPEIKRVFSIPPTKGNKDKVWLSAFMQRCILK